MTAAGCSSPANGTARIGRTVRPGCKDRPNSGHRFYTKIKDGWTRLAYKAGHAVDLERNPRCGGDPGGSIRSSVPQRRRRVTGRRGRRRSLLRRERVNGTSPVPVRRDGLSESTGWENKAMKTTATDPQLGEEGYQLAISGKGVVLAANRSAGLFS